MDNSSLTQAAQAKPEWLRVRAPTGKNYTRLRELISRERLHTVCSSASCPNMGECWEQGTATFMILGNICTRACRFCDVNSYSRPGPVDLDEPQRLASTIASMGLSYAVITSVTRDDLPDGGALHFKRCLEAIYTHNPHIGLEVLTPDFKGDKAALDVVLSAPIHVFNHNLETTRALTPKIRSGAKYDRSLEVLAYVKEKAPHLRTKSGIMLGLGEDLDDVRQTLRDLREAGVDTLTIGQYLQPSPWHHKVMRFAPPSEFAELKAFAQELGFLHVQSGPLVRSSYHAAQAG